MSHILIFGSLVVLMASVSGCDRTNDSKSSSDGNSMSEQALTSAAWCTNSLETMDLVFTRGTTFQFYHRVIFSSNGLLVWQSFTLDHGTQMKALKKSTCRQSAFVFHCDNEDFAALKYEFNAERSELNLTIESKDGRLQRLIERGGTLVKCTDSENKMFDERSWP